jgi:hypothetical protein
MESVPMLTDLRSQVAELFRSPSQDEIDLLVDSSKSQFLPWQFERLLNTAADLLERASEQRTLLLALLAQDLEQRLALDASRLSAKHEAARVTLGRNPMEDPMAQAMIPILKMSKASRTYHSIELAHGQQDDALAKLEESNSAAQKFAATAQRKSLAAEKLKFANQIIMADREWNAEKEDFDRRVEAAKMAQDHVDQRIKAATNGGVFDYQREARIVGQRIVRDYNEAVARLLAAHAGLVDVLAMLPVQGIGTGDAIMDAVVSTLETVRRIVEWHAIRTQYDQGFTIALSVRELCDPETWQAFLDGRAIDLSVSEAYFSPWVFPRLRGIAAEYVGESSRSLRMKLVPPAHGRRSDGARIDQTRVPPCYLGRVASRQEGREPEQNGAVTLMNVCPIAYDGASWSVKVERLGGEQSSVRNAIDDVELRFNCVGIPRQFDSTL